MNKYLLSALIPVAACYATYACAEAPQTQRVIVSGMGETVEAATKNAATAALEQVVGSFIDANTILSKKKEITNGLVNQTKSISQNINNYSSGVIERLNVVNTEQNGPLYKVTVDAVVRVTELKVVMDGIVGKADIDSQSLFAQVQTSSQQSQSLENIVLDNLLKPMLDGSAYEVTIGQAVLPQALQDVKEQQFYQKKYKNKSGTTIILPLEVRLKPDYINKLTSVLSEVQTSMSSAFGDEQAAIRKMTLYNDDFLNGIAIGFPKDGQYTALSFKDMGSFSKFYYISPFNEKLLAKPASMNIRLKDKNGNVIILESFKEACDNWSGECYSESAMSMKDVNFIDLKRSFKTMSKMKSKPGLHFFTIALNKKVFYIDPVRQYKIAVVVDQNKLKSLNGIEVSFSGE